MEVLIALWCSKFFLLAEFEWMSPYSYVLTDLAQKLQLGKWGVTSLTIMPPTLCVIKIIGRSVVYTDYKYNHFNLSMYVDIHLLFFYEG